MSDAESRAAQDNPWVMYLVIRRERDAQVPFMQDVARAAALACVTVLNSEANQQDPLRQESIKQWLDHSFRKVTLRARGSRWQQLAALPGASAVNCEDVETLAFVPMRRSDRPRLLQQAQALIEALPDREAEPSVEVPVLWMNPTLTMSSGKIAAQASHLAAMLNQQRPVTDVQVKTAERVTWHMLADDPNLVQVQDAGLTEIEPGSITFRSVG